MKKIVLIGILMLCSGSLVLGGLTQWSVEDGGNGHFYEVILESSGLTWDKANLAAQSRGGYLATIISEQENTFVFNLINDPVYWNGPRGPWIGGYQPSGHTPSEGWEWVTGEAFTYTNWSLGQPNDSFENDENRLHFGWGEFTIDDSWCDQPDFFAGIISYVVEVPEPAAILLLGLGGLVLRKRRR